MTSTTPSGQHRARIVALAGALLVTLAFTGCSSAADQDRQAGVLGTRLCVQNFSSAVPIVLFDYVDTARGEGRLSRDAVACGEGSSGGLALDVGGTLEMPDPGARKYKLYAQNVWAGAPMAYLTQAEKNAQGGPGGECTSVKGMTINEVRTWDDGVHRFVVTRLADGQWKEFTLDIYDSASPSPDAAFKQC